MYSACRKRLEACGLEPKECAHHQSLKRASVLVVLWEAENEIQTLITRRSLTLRSHPGECCFPGGRRDEEDTDDIATALREAHEEVGLALNNITPLACLRTIESLHHLCVTPVVAWADVSFDVGNCTVNASEVQAVFSVPLELFVKPPITNYKVKWSGEDFCLREYQFTPKDSQETVRITGLTAHIAYEVAQIALVRDKQSLLASWDTKSILDAMYLLKAGYLWKQEVSSRGRPYWNRRYFVLSSNILHHYDNDKSRKQNSANKKHRLALNDLKQTQLVLSDVNKYAWKIETFGGRMVWHLASDDSSNRDEWISILHKATTEC
jgi:coenzyme A diphosphatase NUDT7